MLTQSQEMVKNIHDIRKRLKNTNFYGEGRLLAEQHLEAILSFFHCCELFDELCTKYPLSLVA